MRLPSLFLASFGASLISTTWACASTGPDWRILDPSPGPTISPPIDAIPRPQPLFMGTGGNVAPFILPAADAAHDRALDCLTAAVYYEAASEPRAGQEAVAQVVLNRLRHPAYPKSVCGVVYEGVGVSSTCQFTFACDGSTSRRPFPRLWEGARQVAQAALAGHVAVQVGAATHYHAVSVSPYWRTSLAPVGRIGNHLFYRMVGWRGTAAALTGQYDEDERPPPQGAAGLSTVSTHGAKPAAKTVDFTVWGLKMATISVDHGKIDVRSPS